MSYFQNGLVLLVVTVLASAGLPRVAASKACLFSAPFGQLLAKKLTDVSGPIKLGDDLEAKPVPIKAQSSYGKAELQCSDDTNELEAVKIPWIGYVVSMNDKHCARVKVLASKKDEETSQIGVTWSLKLSVKGGKFEAKLDNLDVYDRSGKERIPLDGVAASTNKLKECPNGTKKVAKLVDNGKFTQELQNTLAKESWSELFAQFKLAKGPTANQKQIADRVVKAFVDISKAESPMPGMPVSGYGFSKGSIKFEQPLTVDSFRAQYAAGNDAIVVSSTDSNINVRVKLQEQHNCEEQLPPDANFLYSWRKTNELNVSFKAQVSVSFADKTPRVDVTFESFSSAHRRCDLWAIETRADGTTDKLIASRASVSVDQIMGSHIERFIEKQLQL